MKLKLSLLSILFVGLTMVSCEKEEFNKVAPESTTIESKDTDATKARMRAPLAVVTPSPCGYGFTCSIDWLWGGPASGSYPYEIWLLGTMVDSGNISDGNNTPWTLSPCTTYTFVFYGSWASSLPTQTLTVTTDGCGGVFLC
jgi:hypothetical protein